MQRQTEFAEPAEPAGYAGLAVELAYFGQEFEAQRLDFAIVAIIGRSAQAQQIAQTGDADVALTALSLALRGQPPGRHLVVPQDSYPALVQTLAVVAGGDEAGAAVLADFVLGPEGQSVLRGHGFLPPPGRT